MSTARTELAPSAGPPIFSAPGAPASPPPLPTAPVDHPSLALPTRAEVNAAGISLFIHLLFLLILAALLIPVRPIAQGTEIDGALGVDDGDGGAFDSVIIGSPDPGKGQDLEKTATTAVDAVPAMEGAMAGSGSGTGSGRFDAVAALASGGGGGTGKGVGFFGTRARADTVVFIVDMSGSMQGHRFNRAVAELTRSLKSLSPQQKFFIFFYNGVTYPMFEQRVAHLLPATPGNLAKAERWIKAFEPDGDTAPEESIVRALRLKPQVIYFLTDGEIPPSTRDTAKRFNTEKKTVIHTIAFESPEGAEILRGIAVDNRGKYRFVQ